MDMRRNAGSASRTGAAASGKFERRLRRMLAGVIVAALFGSVAVAGQFAGGGFVHGQRAGAVAVNGADGAQPGGPMRSASLRREFSVASRTGGLAQWRSVAVSETVRAEPSPEREKRLEEWREEGIRMAAELTGIPEAFFRWLADQGLPVGEFMRFLAPFLEWLELVEPHNGTTAQPPRKGPAPTTI